MIRQFLNHSLLYGLTTFLSRGISLILVPLYTRVLSPVDYGAIDILTIFGNFISIIVTLEISQGFARFLSEVENESDSAGYASTTLWYTVGSYALFVTCALILSDRICLLMMDSLRWNGIVRLAICSVAANGIFLVMQTQLRWALKTKQYNLVSILAMIVTTVVSVYLVVVARYGVAGIFYGQIAGAVAGAGFSWYSSRNSYAMIFDWDRCRQMLKFSMPLVLSSINIYITVYLDRIAIKHFMTLNEVGIYGVGYRFASIVSLFMAGISMSLTPIIYNKYKLSTTPAEIAKIFRYFMSVALTAIILLSAVSYEMMVMLTTPLYLSAWIVIPVIAGAILFSNMYIFMPGMDIAKKTKYITLINVATGIMNVTLNFLFVPFMGIMGAAVATLCSSVTMFVLYAYFSQKFYFVPHQWGRLTTAAFFCAATVLINICIISSLLMPAYLMFIVKTILSAAAATAILTLLIGPLEIRYMKNRLFSSFASKIDGK